MAIIKQCEPMYKVALSLWIHLKTVTFTVVHFIFLSNNLFSTYVTQDFVVLWVDTGLVSISFIKLMYLFSSFYCLSLFFSLAVFYLLAVPFVLILQSWSWMKGVSESVCVFVLCMSNVSLICWMGAWTQCTPYLSRNYMCIYTIRYTV